jgi:predicted secreted Zn-dependent protease
MKKALTWLSIAVGAVGFVLGLRSALARYSAIFVAAKAIWNDPDIKKIRRRAAKRLRKAQKSAAKQRS